MVENNMRQRCRLCAILVNYNGFLDTKACLESIKEAEEVLPFIIIVDNDSKEPRKLEELHETYPYLKIIYNQENIGFGRANNIGIRWAQENLDFEYLLLLNNDTIVEKKAFHYLIEAFQLDTQIGITTSKIMYDYDRNLVWYGGGDINYKRGWPKIADYNQLATLEGADKSRYVTFVSGCVMMFTKESISRIGGFDNDFFMYCEDLDLCMRTSNEGYKIYYESKAVIYHKVQGSINQDERKIVGMQAGNQNLRFLFSNMKSNQYITMRKNLSLVSFVRFNIYYWVEFLLKSLKLFFQGRKDMFSIVKVTIMKIIKT